MPRFELDRELFEHRTVGTTRRTLSLASFASLLIPAAILAVYLDVPQGTRHFALASANTALESVSYAADSLRQLIAPDIAYERGSSQAASAAGALAQAQTQQSGPAGQTGAAARASSTPLTASGLPQATIVNNYIAKPGFDEGTLWSVLSIVKSDLLLRLSQLSAMGNTFVSRTLFERQTDATHDSIENAVEGVRESIDTSVETDALTVSGASTLGALSAGASTLSSLSVTGDAEIGGTLTAGTLSVAAVSSGGAVEAPYFMATSTSASSTFPNLNATNATTTNATSTNFFATNASTTNSTSTNLYSSSLTAGNATSTNLFSALGRFTNAVVDTLLTAVSATITNLTATELVATNATTTNATTTNLAVLGSLTAPYASSTALSVSGTGYFGTASTTNLTVSSLTSGRVPYIAAGGAFADSSALTFDSSLLRLTATNASTTAFTVSGNAYFPGSGVWNSSGNVGIGTTGPGEKLEVAGNVRITGANNALQLLGTTPYLTASDAGITNNFGTDGVGGFLGTQSAHNLTFRTTNLARMTLDASGNVGIGTANPNTMLHLSRTTTPNTSLLTLTAPDGGISAGELFFDSSHASGVDFAVGHIASPDSFAIRDFTAAGLPIRFLISSTGYLGIGNTSPSYKLDVSGFINTDQYSGYKQAGNTILYASSTNFATLGGYGAGTNLMTLVGAINNTAFGYNALNSSGLTTDADYNTAIGGQALSANTTGRQNTGTGQGALQSNTTGSDNTASGVNSLALNTTGSGNIAIGYSALFTATSTSNTTAIGYGALTSLVSSASSADNTAVGFNSLGANTYGGWNTALGYSSLGANTTGSYNTGIGRSALTSNTTGLGNVALGYEALRNNTTGSTNTALGQTALSSNVTGGESTAIGYQALYNSTNGGNTAIGQNSGYGITTGSNNTLIGLSSIAASYNQVTTGSNNIAIGTNVAVPSATASNQLNIGNLIYGTGLDGSGTTLSSGNIGIGTSTPTWGKLTVNGSHSDAAGSAPTGILQVAALVHTGGGILDFGVKADSVPYSWIQSRHNITATYYNIALNPAGGFVGIGTTTPATKLTLVDDSNNDIITFDGPNGTYGKLGAHSLASGGIALDSVTAGQDLRLRTQGTDRLTVAATTGNVGVGTTTPWRTLSVTGTVGFDGLTGATGAGSLCLSSNKEVVYNSASDACLSSLRATKHDISDLSLDGLEIIDQLQPVSFAYNDSDGRVRYGFIAEDTAAVDAHLATYNASGALSGIDDRSILSVVVKAIKELWAQVQGYFARTETLEGEVEALKSRVGQLEAQLGGAAAASTSPAGDGASAPEPEPTPESEQSPVGEVSLSEEPEATESEPPVEDAGEEEPDIETEPQAANDNIPAPTAATGTDP